MEFTLKKNVKNKNKLNMEYLIFHKIIWSKEMN